MRRGSVRSSYFAEICGADTEVHKVLEKHPKLLLFRKEGDVLALDRARAQVNKGQDGKVGVQMYREGAFLRRPKL